MLMPPTLMKTSAAGVLDILAHEALVTRRYRDVKGIWTFGVGHTSAAGEPDPKTITDDRPISEVIAVFRRDLATFEHRVNQHVTVPLQQHEFDALVSFDFNTGGVHRAALTRRLNAGDRAGAARAFMNWLKPKSLKARRTKEMVLFRDGTYSSDGTVLVYSASPDGRRLTNKRVVDARRFLSARAAAAPVDTQVDIDAAMAAKLNHDQKALVAQVQRWLTQVGYPEVGRVDGICGDRTRDAMLAYRRNRNLPLTDGMDEAFLTNLKMAVAEGWRRPTDRRRAMEPKRHILERSKTLQTSFYGKIAALLGIGGGAAGNAANQILNPDALETNLSVAERVVGFLGDNWPLVLGLTLAAGGTWLAFQLIDRFRVNAEREGRHF